MKRIEKITERVKTDNKKLLEIQERQKRQAEISAVRFRKTIKFLTSKPVMYVALLAVQFGIIIFGFSMLNKFINTDIFLIVSGVLSYIFAIYIINSKTANEYKIVWIAVVLALTVLGMVAYLIFGKKTISRRKMKRIHEKVGGVLEHFTEDKDVLQNAQAEDAFLYHTAKYIYANGRLSLSSAAETVYFDIGEKYFDRLKSELKAAEKFIFLEYFIIAKGQLWSEIFDILKEKSQSGIEVRIIYDDLGCLSVLPKSFGKSCAEAGIRLYRFNKLRPVLDVAQNNRTHRKIAVIDGKCAFTGGVNIADEYANLIEKHGYWKDTGMMVKGAAVKNFTLMFLLNWSAKFGSEDISPYIAEYNDEKEKVFCLPFCDMPGSNKTICEQVYIKMIYEAKDYVYINTPYFIITDKMKEALIAAAESGVDVRITVPHTPDKKTVFGLTQAFYTPLVSAGVKIYQYIPGFIHAKSIVVDDKYGVIGTSNMDFRSFYLHHECNVFLYKGICADMRADYEKTCGLSALITPEAASGIPVKTRIWRAFLRLFAPLM